MKKLVANKKNYILIFIQKQMNNNDVLIINWHIHTLKKKKNSNGQIPISREKPFVF